MSLNINTVDNVIEEFNTNREVRRSQQLDMQIIDNNVHDSDNEKLSPIKHSRMVNEKNG